MSRRVGIFAACCVGGAAAWNTTSTGASAETLAGRYEVALGLVGLMATALFVAQVATLLPTGRIVDRYGTRRMAIAALIVVAAGNAVGLVDLGFGWALASRLIVGVAVGMAFVAGTSHVSLLGGGAVSLGLYGGSALAGAGLAVAVVPLLESWAAWRSPYASASVVALLAVIAMAFSPSAPRASPKPPRTSIWRILVEGPIISFGAVHAATFGISVVLSNWVVTLLTRRAGLTIGVAASAGGLVTGAAIFARPIGGWLVGRWPGWARRILVTCMVIGAMSTLALGFAQGPLLAIMSSAAIGFFGGLPFAAMITGLVRNYEHAPAAAVGAITVWASIVILVATPLVGLTFSLPSNGMVGFLAMALLWLGSIKIMPSQHLLVPPNGRVRIQSD